MENSIFDYYQRVIIKLEDIEKTRKSSINDLDELVLNFDRLIKEIETFLIVSYDFHYGYFLLNLKKKYQIRKDFVAAVTYESTHPILIINPITLGKYTLKEIIFILCHEIEHLVLKHHIFLIKMNSIRDEIKGRKLNIAFDASVNDRLINDIQKGLDLMTVPNGLITSEYLGKILEKELEFNQHYLYYYELIKDMQFPEIGLCSKNYDITYEYKDSTEETNQTEDNRFGNEQSESYISESNQSNQDNRNENSYDDIDNLDTNFNEILEGTPSSFDDISQTCNNEMDEEVMENIFNAFIKKVLKSMNNKSRGLFSSDYEEVIEKINKKPEINWKKELKKFLGNISYGYKKSILRLNRRQPERYDLRGTITDKLVKIVIAIDTSGSMDTLILERIMNEIDKILKHKKIEMTIIECDYEIQKIYKVNKAKDIDYKLKGRGGTRFTPVINYINNNKKFRNALLIYFTDGYGELEIPRPLVYRMLWIVYGNTYLSVKENFGKVLYLKEVNYE